MKNKIDSMIALVSFGALAGAHMAIIPALVAFQITKDSNVGFWAYVVSVVPVSLVSVYVFLGIAARMTDVLGSDGEWITVQSESGAKHPVKRKHIKFTGRGGVKLPEVERIINDRQ